MKTASIAMVGDRATGAAATPTRRPAEVFALGNVQHLIAPGSTAEDLMGSASLLLGSGLAVLESDYERMNTAQYGAFYLMQQAHATLLEAMAHLHQQPKGGA